MRIPQFLYNFGNLVMMLVIICLGNFVAASDQMSDQSEFYSEVRNVIFFLKFGEKIVLDPCFH